MAESLREVEPLPADFEEEALLADAAAEDLVVLVKDLEEADLHDLQVADLQGGEDLQMFCFDFECEELPPPSEVRWLFLVATPD